MTPWCSILLEVVRQDYVYHGLSSIFWGFISIVSFIGGFKLMMYNHEYIVSKEFEYGVRY